MTTHTTIPQGFDALGINPQLLLLLTRKRFLTPTPIQAQTIPVALSGKDVIGIAQTGTGKTLAFGVPILQRLAALRDAQGLVLAPTRELAQQINEAILNIGRPFGLRTAVLIGGESISKQLQQLHQKPRLLIATPGRLLDHLAQKSVTLSRVRILVLDEADRMLDMGFAPQITKILSHVPRERQTMLFSATMPNAIARLSAHYMKLPVRVEIARAGTAAEHVTHEVFFVSKLDKRRLLERLLNEYHGTILVFSRTKYGAKKITKEIASLGHTVAELHSNRTLAQRRTALDGFKGGKTRVLVATDIAARGIDVTDIELVLNFDLPDNPEDYVHRIGRTARAGKSGRAISFATPDQRRDVRDIERLIQKSLPVSPLPELPPSHTAYTFAHRETHRSYRTRHRQRAHSSRNSTGQGRQRRPSRTRSRSSAAR